MKRKILLLGGLGALANSTWCHGEYGSVASLGPDHTEVASQTLAAVFAQGLNQGVHADTEAEWTDLKTRFQAVLAKGECARVWGALVAARMRGSSTLASMESPRENYQRAMKQVEEYARSGRRFDERAIGSLHNVVMGDNGLSMRRAGEQVRAGREKGRPYAPGAMVRGLVADLVDLVNGPVAHTMLAPQLAANVDLQFVSIHPFADGNGRTGRLLTDWLVLRAGYPPVVQTEGAAISWRDGEVDSEAHIRRITAGMSASVAIAESQV